MKLRSRKYIIITLILLALIASYCFELFRYFDFQYLKQQEHNLRLYYETSPVSAVLWYAGVYVVATALSFPGAAVLTLLGGALFGLWLGTLLVSIASTLGATLAFLAARFLVRDWVTNRLGARVDLINSGVARDGAYYLFALRLAPLVPFFVINLAFGLTDMPVWQFFVVSQVGMLLGTIAFVNAGTQLAALDSVKDVLSPSMFGAFILLSILPVAGRLVTRKLRSSRGGYSP